MDLSAMLNPEEEDAQNAALMEALRKQQEQQEVERTGLRSTLARQQGQAGGLRTLSLLASIGSNPLLQGIQRAAGEQGGQLEGLAARTEQRLASSDGSNSPLAMARYNLAALRTKLQQQEAEKGRAFRAAEAEKNRRNAQTVAAIASGQKNADTTEKQTQAFGDEVVKSGAPGFYVRYDQAKAILDRNKGDLPGFGRIEGRLPDDVISEEGRALRQSIGQLLSEYRKGQTGAGMSDSERVEYGRITGLLQTGDEQSVRQGLEALKGAVDERVRATAGGFRPEAVAAYGSRVPRVGAALALPADENGQPTLETPPATKTGRAAAAPASPKASTPTGVLPRIVYAKGATPTERRTALLAEMKEGEVVRVPMGNGTYNTVRKVGGKLARVKE